MHRNGHTEWMQKGKSNKQFEVGSRFWQSRHHRPSYGEAVRERHDNVISTSLKNKYVFMNGMGQH